MTGRRDYWHYRADHKERHTCISTRLIRLTNARRRIPLGHGTMPIEISHDVHSGPLTRPFGLRDVVELTRDADNVVDISAVEYDPARQVSVIDVK